MIAPTFRLDRSVFIHAKPETVFAFFQDSARWASWWGAGSTIDPRPGGKVYVRYPGNVEASGEIIEIAPASRLVFTYGYHKEGSPVPPGSSRVTIVLGKEAGGTRLTLTHELPTEASRDEHIQGWRYQLSLFANTVANLVNANAGPIADAWFEAWVEPDDAKRKNAFQSIAVNHVSFGDRYSCLAGIDEITLHAGAAQKFMPGMKLHRQGDARHCLGTALVDWTVPGPQGAPVASGTNVFRFDDEGKITDVVGLWR
jgi:uncharacterized protein YndB with AHSA1/START domain